MQKTRFDQKLLAHICGSGRSPGEERKRGNGNPLQWRSSEKASLFDLDSTEEDLRHRHKFIHTWKRLGFVVSWTGAFIGIWVSTGGKNQFRYLKSWETCTVPHPTTHTRSKTQSLSYSGMWRYCYLLRKYLSLHANNYPLATLVTVTKKKKEEVLWPSRYLRWFILESPWLFRHLIQGSA